MDCSKALPDELWVLVLGRLPLGALLEAREVCRRWRRLVLDCSVWSHRALDCQRWLGNGKAALGAVRALRVAPCLRSLALSEDSASAISEAATTAKTAEAELNLSFVINIITQHQLSSNIKLERVLRRQVELELGSLRKVRMSGATNAVALVELAMRANLEELEVADIFPNNPERKRTVLPAAAAAGNASLKTLRVSGRTNAAMLVLQPLLRAHASTLQCVSVLCEWSGGEEELLARCPLLRQLELWVCESNAKVLTAAAAGSARIAELTLQYSPHACNWEAFLAPVPSFAHLRRLSLPPGRVSLRALAGLQSAAILEELCLGDRPGVNWSGLLAALRGLPRLHSLSLSKADGSSDQPGPSDAVVLPRLRQLRVREPCAPRTPEKPWCCLPFLHSLVRLNPQLHVMGLRSAHECSFSCTLCPCCEHGLHSPELSRHEHFSLCGHGEGEQCCLPGLHTRPERCPCSPHCSSPREWKHIC